MLSAKSMLIFLATLVVCLIFSFPLRAAVCSPQVKIVAEDPAANDLFGNSVAISNNIIVVGSYQDDDGGTNSGSAFVFTETTPGTYSQVSKLVALDPASDDYFGISVAISNNIIVVGSYWDDDTHSDSGSAYVFTETTPGTYSQVSKLVALDPASDDYFGISVAISNNIIVVGSYLDDDGGWDSGSAYVFTETTPGTYSQVSKLVALDPAVIDYFGYSVAISNNIIVVGSHMDSDGGIQSGSAYVFTETTPGTYSQVSKLVAEDPAAYDYFGISVAISNNIIVVGSYRDGDGGDDSGSAYVFTETTPGTYSQVSKLVAEDPFGTDYFGNSVAISNNIIVVGSYQDDDGGSQSGSAYVFTETTPGTYSQVSKLVALDPAEIDYFGYSVAISNNIIVVGAYNDDDGGSNSGSAYIFETIDDCADNVCEHGSTCVDFFHSYCCDCPVSHGGEYCTDCLCKNGGVCKDDIDTGIGYCDCTDTNALGSLCETPCENGGIDDATTGWTTCDCTGLHFVGGTCHKTCNNGFSDATSSNCNCTGSGATGKFCTKDDDDCLSSPCQNGGTCTDFGVDLFPSHNNEFNCSCDGTGYHGPTCEISDCSSSHCSNNGMCEQAYDFDGYPSGVKCNCSLSGGYEGEFCQSEIDECASSPCLNNGICTDLLGDFECDCVGTGYEGPMCTDDIDDCGSSPCLNDGTCKDKGKNKFQCTCDEFWEGTTCSDDVDDCILKGYYCENQAGCSDDPVNLGDVLCDCSIAIGGFTGKYCNVPIEDACVSFNPCQHGGKCIVDDMTKAISCNCDKTGYQGEICDVALYYSECDSSPCANEGQCYDPSSLDDDWFCDCNDGYTGDLCEFRACDSMPCQNDGICANDELVSYTCECAENWSGPQCEVEEGDQVGASSSSSSTDPDNTNLQEGGENDASEKDNGSPIVIIIIVVVVVVIATAGGVLYWTKSQSTKTFTMPT